ncbi:hypothetical protein KEM54_006918 [Ascosphaera aggregata]|nr:hypothetical protein KEM54_006918 [Ascosphaera aggregata]
MSSREKQGDYVKSSTESTESTVETAELEHTSATTKPDTDAANDSSSLPRKRPHEDAEKDNVSAAAAATAAVPAPLEQSQRKKILSEKEQNTSETIQVSAENSKGVRTVKNDNPQEEVVLNPSKKRARNYEDNETADSDVNVKKTRQQHLDTNIIATNKQPTDNTAATVDDYDGDDDDNALVAASADTKQDNTPASDTMSWGTENTQKEDGTAQVAKNTKDTQHMQDTQHTASNQDKDHVEKTKVQESAKREHKPIAGKSDPIKISNPFFNVNQESPFAQLAKSNALDQQTSRPALDPAPFAITSNKSGAESSAAETDPAIKPTASMSYPTTATATKSSEAPKTLFGSFASGFKASAFANATGFAAATSVGPKLNSFASGAGFSSGKTLTPPLKAASPFGTPSVLGASSDSKTHSALTPKSEEDKKEAEEKAKTVTSVTLKETPEKPGPGFGEEDDEGDSRFQHQKTSTGEEEETTVFSCRAKLFYFAEGEWKERGAGALKINLSGPSDDHGKNEEEGKETRKRARARLVMRADGVWRVILNTPLFKGMKIGDAAGNAPTTKSVSLTAVENGHPVLFTLKTHNVDIAKDLHKTVNEVLKQL